MTPDDTVSAYAYGLIREEYHLATGHRISYGIALYAHPRDTGSATVITAVRDITSDRGAIDRFIRQCNELALSPLHLADAVDDFFNT